MPIAFEVLAQHLLSDPWELLKAWLPNGRRQGREWCVGSLQGEAGQSLKINIDSGKWKDFATGERGQDLIALYAAMHQLSQGEAAKALGGAEVALPARTNGAGATTRQPPPIEEGAPLAHHDDARERPPPDISLDPRHFKHPQHGVPAYLYAYRDDDGELLSIVARYEGAEGKHFCPFTWVEGQWRKKHPAKPRPLYGLDRLAQLTGRVVVVEGEKAADALQGVLKACPVLTWPMGAVNWRYADWRPLAGRRVLLWPDADPPGVEAMQGVAGVLLPLGCVLGRVEAEGLPDGYDAADAVAAGLHGAPLRDWLRARERVIELHVDPPQEPQRVHAPGNIIGGTFDQTPPPDDTPHPAEIPEAFSAAALVQHAGIKVTKHGPHQNLSNAVRMVRAMIEQRHLSELWWDEFLQQVRYQGAEWADRDTLALTTDLQHNFAFEKLGTGLVDQAVSLVAWEQRRNCAKEWLQALRWDGTERLSYLLAEGFGTARTDYTMAVGRCFVMGMAARVLMPGCKLDYLPVFEGEQGVMKSQALAVIGGPWFTETMESVTSKDFYLSLQGKMLVEIAEFSSFRRAESEAIKAAISRPTDRFRVPYEKRPADHPRSCAFAATTNDTEWNLDPTGARRFWPVRCGSIVLEWIAHAREQLFAEAVALLGRVSISASTAERVAAGAAWWDVPTPEARVEQDARYQSDTVATGMRLYVEAQREPFTTLHVLQYGLRVEGAQLYDRALQSRVRAQLLHWGYRNGVKDGERWWEPKGAPQVQPSEEDAADG